MASVVASGLPLAYNVANSPFVNDPALIFTVPSTVSATIESVWIFAEYDGGAPGGDIFILRGLAQNGKVQWAQQSPAFTNDDTQINVELTFSIGSVGLDQVPQSGPPPTQVLVFGGFANVPLPVVNLGPNAMLTLQVIQGTVGTSGPINIASPTITYDDGGALGAAVPLDLTPYLLPVATG